MISIEKLITPANVVTILRGVLLIPYYILLISHEGLWQLIALVTLALTFLFGDCYDGKLARDNGPTRGGKFLDQFVDKAFSLPTLVLLHGRFAAIFLWPMVIIDSVLLTVRVVRLFRMQNFPSPKWGRYKFGVLSASILYAIIFNEFWGANIMLILALGLSIGSIWNQTVGRSQLLAKQKTA